MTLDPEKENPGPGTYNNPEVPRTSKFSHITYGTSRDKRFDNYGTSLHDFRQQSARCGALQRRGEDFWDREVLKFEVQGGNTGKVRDIKKKVILRRRAGEVVVQAGSRKLQESIGVRAVRRGDIRGGVG